MGWLSRLFGREQSDVNGWVAELAGEAWAMEPNRLRALWAQLDEMRLTVPPSAIEARGERKAESDLPPYNVVSGVAHLPIRGYLTKSVPWWAELFGISMTSTVDTQRALSRAIGDPEVRSVLLRIDSPGGTVSGIQELGDAIYAARSRKPVSAHTSDLAASAAYWLGSQATRFTGGQTAEVGSIGVYKAIVDSSKAAENQGVKVHLIRSGPHKGTGAPGVPVTDEQISVEQEIVDRLAGIFVQTVARGRGVAPDKISELATGRTWLAEEAKNLGLIDAVESVETAHGNVAALGLPTLAQEGDGSMANANGGAPAPDPQVAELELRAVAAETRATALEAEVASMKEAIVGVRKQLCGEVLDRAMLDGRLAPAQRPHIEKMAEGLGFDAAAIRSHVEVVPKGTFTRSKALGSEPPENKGTDDPAADMPPEVASILRSKGVDPAQASRAANVVKVIGQKAELADGSIVVLKDYLRGSAA